MASKRKPRLAESSSRLPVHKVDAKPIREDGGWAFSLRYWRQIEYFGLSECGPRWFTSLLARLADLSDRPVDQFLSDPGTRQAHHYHDVDWTVPNLPIQRRSLTWLPEDYRDNDRDFPFFQFSITGSMGRVVGFWGETRRVFYIVLLDPMHNIHPTISTGRRVDACWPLPTDYERLMVAVDEIRRLRCDHPACPFPVALQDLETVALPESILMRFPINETLMTDFRDLTQFNANLTARDIFEAGIYYCITEHENRTAIDTSGSAEFDELADDEPEVA